MRSGLVCSRRFASSSSSVARGARSRRSSSARCARRSSASPIELIVSRDAVGEAERAPQPREHHDLLGVDVGAGEAERLDVELVELPVAALLRPLVAEHRAAGPHALRPLVGERVLDRGADDAGGRLGTQRQALAVQLVLERVHLVLDDVGRVADAAHEQRRRLDDRHAQVAVAVLREHARARRPRSAPRAPPRRAARRSCRERPAACGGRHRSAARQLRHATPSRRSSSARASRCAARGSPP